MALLSSLAPKINVFPVWRPLHFAKQSRYKPVSQITNLIAQIIINEVKILVWSCHIPIHLIGLQKTW